MRRFIFFRPSHVLQNRAKLNDHEVCCIRLAQLCGCNAVPSLERNAAPFARRNVPTSQICKFEVCILPLTRIVIKQQP